VKLYLSRDLKHQALCAAQIGACTLAIGAQVASSIGVPYATGLAMSCAVVSEGIKTMETPV